MSEYIILLQKITQAEPHAVLAHIKPEIVDFLHQVAASIKVTLVDGNATDDEKMEQ